MRKRPGNGFRVELLPVKILWLLTFGTIFVSFLVSVKIHSMGALEDSSDPFSAALAFAMWRPPTDEEREATRIMSLVLQDPERQPILRILKQAGYDFNDARILPSDIWKALPNWTDILNLYGEPRVLGLETCQRYRDEVADARFREIGVAGMFNSGTNILHQRTCTSRNGYRWRFCVPPHNLRVHYGYFSAQHKLHQSCCKRGFRDSLAGYVHIFDVILIAICQVTYTFRSLKSPMVGYKEE